MSMIGSRTFPTKFVYFQAASHFYISHYFTQMTRLIYIKFVFSYKKAYSLSCLVSLPKSIVINQFLVLTCNTIFVFIPTTRRDQTY